MQMNRLWWVIGILVVIVLVAYFVKREKSDYNASPSPTATVTDTASPGESPVSGVGPSGTATSTAYTQLVTTYSGKRIQFDALCQATPNRLVVKSGTKIMFDNRSGDARIISINGSDYRFPGYGYWIIPIKSSTLPKTITLNCGSAVNVGTLVIEK